MLFKYCSLREDFFENRYIRFTQPELFNDPFEGQVNNLELLEHYKAESNSLDYIEERIRRHGTGYQNLGIVSLSKNDKNLLMWSHYAEQHKGLVLMIDTKEPPFCCEGINESTYIGNAFDIEYDNNRPSLEMKTFVIKNPPCSLLRKSNHWSYEAEVRIFLSKSLASDIKYKLMSNKIVSELQQNNLEYDSFVKEEIWLKQLRIDSLKGIIIGALADKDMALYYYIRGVIKGTISRDTKLFFSRLSPTKYEVEYIEFSDMGEILELFNYNKTHTTYYILSYLRATLDGLQYEEKFYGMNINEIVRCVIKEEYIEVFEVLTEV